MEKQGWKILAIVAICLFATVLIGTISLYNFGASILQGEEECNNMCFDIPASRTFYYDPYTEACECYNANGDTIKETFK